MKVSKAAATAIIAFQLLGAAIVIGFWGTVIYVVFHFIMKWW